MPPAATPECAARQASAAADGAALPNPLCPLCGNPNHCAPAACGRLAVDCWCSKLQIAPTTLARIADADRRLACICPSCAAAGG